MVAALVLVCSAHVGSPDQWFEGDAGPYHLRVLVRAPQVVPARAEITVRTLGCRVAPSEARGLDARPCSISRITATSRLWNGGGRGAPPPDALSRVSGDSTLWTMQLWIMLQGSFAVLIHVDGAEGPGDVTVPFTATATQVFAMKPAFGAVLAALGVFLIVGLLTIAGAAARESTLPAGTEPGPHAIVRARRVRVAVLLLVALLLTGGRAWWNAEQRSYSALLYRPLKFSATVDSAGALRITVDSADVDSRNFGFFAPDHGKLMHAFLVSDLSHHAIAHLHPVSRGYMRFESAVPPLPAGRYKLFADVVRETGFAETLVSVVEIGAPTAAWKPSDPDDAVFIGDPPAKATGGRYVFDDGAALALESADSTLHAGVDAGLRFALADAKGTPLDVEPYMGMRAHAVVLRTDDSVFVHLHPAGTASMGAQRALALWAADSLRRSVRQKLRDTASLMAHGSRPAVEPGVFEFPYAFPSPGTYRVWVQFRRGGVIRTAPFDVRVAP